MLTGALKRSKKSLLLLRPSASEEQESEQEKVADEKKTTEHEDAKAWQDKSVPELAAELKLFHCFDYANDEYVTEVKQRLAAKLAIEAARSGSGGASVGGEKDGKDQMDTVAESNAGGNEWRSFIWTQTAQKLCGIV